MTSPSDKISASPDDSRTVNLFRFRGDEAAECMLETCVRSLILAPLDGEYACDPVQRIWNGNLSNTSAGGKVGDFALSIKQAFEHFPLTESVTIQVPRYIDRAVGGTDIGICLPGVVSRDTAFDDSAEPWSATIAGTSYNRASAKVRLLTQPANKGTPSEQSLKAAIAEIKSYKRQNGLPVKVILQPIAIIDVEGYSDSRDFTAGNNFAIPYFMILTLGGYGCFMVDTATIAKDTGCESIIVGTGLSGLSTGVFASQFITQMEATLTAVQAVFADTNIRIGLACDLDEITALTPLFSNANLTYIAFNYQPVLGSWTDDPDAQTPAQQSAKSIYDLDYLRSQIVPPVADGVIPADKQIVLHNIGCRSIHRGANAPADFTSNPPASNGNQDNLMQRAYIEAILSYFRDMPQYDLTRSSVAAWDIRLYSHIQFHPAANTIEWRTGFALNGKVQIPPAPASAFGNYDYCNSANDIVIDGRVYESAAIKGDGIKRVGAFTNKTQTLTLPRNSPVIQALRDGRHPVPITLTVLQGHITDTGYSNFRTIWAGRVTGVSRVKDEVTIEGRAFSMGLGRIGVNERYNQGCGHVLHYGRCLATRRPITATATNTDGNNSIYIASSLTGTDRNYTLDDWKNGTVSWQQGTQTITARITLAEVFGNGTFLHLARPAPKWEDRVPVTLLVGCNHTKENCHRLHSNLPNYGGNPNIPDVNPFEIQPPVFY